MSGFYELIGRIVVGLVRWRYQRELRIAAVVGVTAAALGLGALIAWHQADDDEDA